MEEVPPFLCGSFAIKCQAPEIFHICALNGTMCTSISKNTAGVTGKRSAHTGRTSAGHHSTVHPLLTSIEPLLEKDPAVDAHREIELSNMYAEDVAPKKKKMTYGYMKSTKTSRANDLFLDLKEEAMQDTSTQQRSGKVGQSIYGRGQIKRNSNERLDYFNLFQASGADRLRQRIVPTVSMKSRKRESISEQMILDFGDVSGAGTAQFFQKKRMTVGNMTSIFANAPAPRIKDKAAEPESTGKSLSFFPRPASLSPTFPRSSTDGSKAKSMQSIVKERILDRSGIEPKLAPVVFSQEKKEVSEELRLLIFGKIGNEGMAPRDRQSIFYEPVGTKKEIQGVYKFWTQLDADSNGRVGSSDFNLYLATKAAYREDNYSASRALIDKKVTFTIVDILKIVWPVAEFKDLQGMIKCLKEIEDELDAFVGQPTPPLLDPEELEGMVQNFKYMDKDNSGDLSLEELVQSDLITAEQAHRYCGGFDGNGSGELDMGEFCMMLCPFGYRAFPDAIFATNKEGTPLFYEENFGWRNLHRATSGICVPSLTAEGVWT